MGLFFKVGFLQIHGNISTNLYNSIGLVGILSGLFQYYINRYEDKIQSKLSFKVNRLLISAEGECSFNNFEEFLDNNSKKYTNISSIIKTMKESEGFEKVLLSNKFNRKTINIYQMLVPSPNINMYKLLEEKIVSTHKSEDDNLVNAYRIFFKLKEDETIIKIKEEGYITELLDMLSLNINFLAEAETEIIGIKSKKIEKLKTAEDFISNFKLRIFDKLLTDYIYN